MEQGQGRSNRYTRIHKDTFGITASLLSGGAQWTYRLVRGTKIAMPHIAKNDVFTYQAQLNHDKELGQAIDGFHIHIKPIGVVTNGQVISLDFAWGWFTQEDIFPNTLPNTGNTQIILTTNDQYKTLIKDIINGNQAVNPRITPDIIIPPTNEGYSSEFFIQVTRRNDATDTYPGEFALTFGDVHYPSDREGSFNEYID